MEFDVGTFFGISGVVGLLGYVVMEVLLKGLVPAIAASRPARKRALAACCGIVLGLVFALAAPVPLPWWQGVLAGLSGMGVIAGARWAGVDLLRGSKTATTRHAAGLVAMVCLVATSQACTAAQWRDGLWCGAAAVGAAADCLDDCMETKSVGLCIFQCAERLLQAGPPCVQLLDRADVRRLVESQVPAAQDRLRMRRLYPSREEQSSRDSKLPRLAAGGGR
ncbi:MAG: hypothetical protein FJ087_08055 [Deltaproteobacteria bacterium]|nr:hypothetical protein [Deltaproteobacteria bacterium]